MGLALRGSRNMDAGIEDVTEADIRAQVLKQARSVQIKSVLTSAALTVVALLLCHTHLANKQPANFCSPAVCCLCLT